MALLDDGVRMHFRYTGVHNKTAGYFQAHASNTPCAVICLACAGVSEKWGEYRGVGGRASVFRDIVVFSASGQLANTENVIKRSQGPTPRTLVEQMNRNYRALRSLDIAPIV